MSLTLDAGAAVKNGSRRSFITGVGLTFVAAAAAVLTPRRYRFDFSQDRLAQQIPLQFAGWSASGEADDIVPDPLANNSPFEQTLTRTYSRPGAPQVMLLITYHGPESKDLKVHRPEICYKVAGFDLRDFSTATISVPSSKAINAQSFSGLRGSRLEQVFYWTRVGNRFPATMMDQRLTALQDGVDREISDGLLFRVSLIGPNLPAARAALQSFSYDLLKSTTPHGRSLLLGAGPTAS